MDSLVGWAGHYGCGLLGWVQMTGPRRLQHGIGMFGSSRHSDNPIPSHGRSHCLRCCIGTFLPTSLCRVYRFYYFGC
jgi:hypothetical protein